MRPPPFLHERPYSPSQRRWHPPIIGYSNGKLQADELGDGQRQPHLPSGAHARRRDYNFRRGPVSIGSDVKPAAESSKARVVHLFACSRFAFAVARLYQGASASLFPRPYSIASTDCCIAAAFFGSRTLVFAGEHVPGPSAGFGARSSPTRLSSSTRPSSTGARLCAGG
jgi:hypothetical protein